MNKKPKIGLVQEAWYPDPEMHRTHLQEGIRSAAGQGARLICLQELTLCPYFPAHSDLDATPFAETIPTGPTCQFAAAMARETGAWIIASLYEQAGSGYNTAVCFGPDGTLAGKTRKQHIPYGFGYQETDYFSQGDSDYPVHPLAGTRVALPTCYDQWFPEVARIYALSGAEVIVYPTAIGSEPTAPDFNSQPLWQKVIVANGIMNATFMVAVNRIGVEGPVTFYGSSFISDPLGNILAEAPLNQPAVLVAECDFTTRHLWQELFPLLTQRQPETYSRLLQK